MMLKDSPGKTPPFFTSILFLSGFFLFLEWLYPVKEVTDTGDLAVFIMYALFCFFISVLQIRWWLSFLIKGAGMLFIINGLFFTQSFLSKIWFDQLFMELSRNMNALFSQEWYDVTALFRSVLFLVLIWLMSYLLYYWFVVMKRIFLFILLTFVYLTVLDTFTVYDASLAIIRTFIIAFVALGMANLFREINKEEIHFPRVKNVLAWIVPLIAIVLFSSAIGYIAPKQDPRWPDPVPFLKSAAESADESGSVIQKVGYGEDDSRLGGSFIQDYTPVFQVAAKDENYWRIETKDVYTGKGWENSASNIVKARNDSISLNTFNERVKTEQETAYLDFQGNTTIPKLIYPYGINKVNGTKNTELLLDLASDAIHTKRDGKDISLASYSITYDNPSFSTDSLKKTSTADPPEIATRYTQLPDELPQRIRELAKEITEPFDNRYDKAKAVEKYFGQNGFVYQTENVPVPGRNDDYVDQFLFDSKVGYCDNYSTSMTVMLRTLDIPARWVKGFTSGQKIASNVGEGEDTYNVYEITNANAHSWVEVYFAETGWVPFEPTQGFSNLSEFLENQRDARSDDAEEAASETEQQQEQEQPREEERQLEEEKKEKESQAANSADASFSIDFRMMIAIAAFLLLIAFILYRFRFRINKHVLSRKLHRTPNLQTFQDAYHFILGLLAHRGVAKKPGETLREYAIEIDGKYETEEMSALTKAYERILYRNEMDANDIEAAIKQWENLIRRIMA